MFHLDVCSVNANQDKNWARSVLLTRYTDWCTHLVDPNTAFNLCSI